MENEITENQTFMLAGKALFTMMNTETGKRFTYKIKKADNSQTLWFVSVLNGPDNWTNYQYLGIISAGNFRKTAKSAIEEGAQSHKVFKWFWERVKVNSVPKGIKMYHEGRCGRCGRCGRRLTVPSSIETGYGPECVTIMQ